MHGHVGAADTWGQPTSNPDFTVGVRFCGVSDLFVQVSILGAFGPPWVGRSALVVLGYLYRGRGGGGDAGGCAFRLDPRPFPHPQGAETMYGVCFVKLKPAVLALRIRPCWLVFLPFWRGRFFVIS